ncbi:MAG: hypothetical protein GC153_11200 [Alphaproteobacteria bacterium]|nr:hypothetical protein [Alphaproteobacteria bacterium]
MNRAGFFFGLLAVAVLSVAPAGVLPHALAPPCDMTAAANAHFVDDGAPPSPVCSLAQCLYYCMAIPVAPAPVSAPIDSTKVVYAIAAFEREGLAIGPPVPPPRVRLL